MPASLEIQHGRVCYGTKCYGRAGKKLENTAGVFPYVEQLFVFPERRESPVGVLGESEFAI